MAPGDIESAIGRILHARVPKAAGRVKPIVDRVYPLARTGEAHAYLEAGGHLGKVMLEV